MSTLTVRVYPDNTMEVVDEYDEYDRPIANAPSDDYEEFQVSEDTYNSWVEPEDFWDWYKIKNN